MESLGEVELKWISVGDIKKYAKFLEQDISFKDFTIKILFHQLIKPKIKLNNFKKLSDIEIIKLGKAFIKKEDYFFEYFQDTGDFFKDFRKAINAKNKKIIEKFKVDFDPIIKSTQEMLASFNNNYASVVQQTLFSSSYIQDAIRELSLLGKQTQEIQLKMSLSLEPIIEQFSATARILTESIKPQIDIWQKWTEQNKSLFDGISLKLSEFQKRYKIAEPKAVAVLRKYNWFISPNMPIDFILKVVQVGKKNGRQDRAMNKLFIDYFSENNWQNLETMGKNWKRNPIFKKRFKIIYDCIEILKTANAKINVVNVILPALISQIDGFLTDYLVSKNISVRRYTEKKSQFKQHSTKPISPELNELANSVFLNILFQRSLEGQPLETPFNFNRHKIIHGENINYGRKVYLIRCFLIIDFLASLK